MPTLLADALWVDDPSVQSGNVTPLSASHPWLTDALRRLAEIARLPPNWDSYGSRPIQRESARQAGNLLVDLSVFGLPTPQIFPVPGGGIQLEWSNSKCEVEIEVLPDGSIEYLIVDEQGQTREGSILLNSTFDLNRLVYWFVSKQPSVVFF